MDKKTDYMKTEGENGSKPSTPRIPAGIWRPVKDAPKRKITPGDQQAVLAEEPEVSNADDVSEITAPESIVLPQRSNGIVKEWLALLQDIAFQKRVRVATGQAPPERKIDPERGLVTPLIRDVIKMIRQVLKRPKRLLMLMFIGITLFPMIRAIGTAAWLPSSSKALIYPLIISVALIAFAMGKHANKLFEVAGKKQDCGLLKRAFGLSINRRWTIAIIFAVLGIVCALASEGIRYRCVLTLPLSGVQEDYLTSLPVEDRAAAEANLKRDTVFLPLFMPEAIKEEAKYYPLRDEQEGNVWSMAYLDTEYLNVMLISHATLHRFHTILLAIVLYSGTILSLTVACALSLDIDDPELDSDPDGNTEGIDGAEGLIGDTDVVDATLEVII